MSNKKWLIVLALVAAFGLATLGVVAALIWWFLTSGGRPVDYSLPVYTIQQTDSTHPWYRRTTITSGTAVYVEDYEEYPLQLANLDPTDAVGRTPVGGGKVCAIPGQKPTDYLTMDCGSEMPAYEVFRNSQLPPFDWRNLKFQALSLAGPIGRTQQRQTKDPAVIEDVLRTLREGTPTTTPAALSVTITNISRVNLVSDQLPGLVFSPAAYQDAAGSIWLTESFAVEYINRTERIHARWIPAGPLFAKWAQTP